MENRCMKTTKLWADREKIENVPVKDAWCEQCCDTAALWVKGKWHCGSCGTTDIRVNDPMRNYGDYELDRVAKQKAQRIA